MLKRRLKHQLSGPAAEFRDDARGQRFGVFKQRLSIPAPPAREQGRCLACSFNVKPVMQAQNMRRIGRGERNPAQRARPMVVKGSRRGEIAVAPRPRSSTAAPSPTLATIPAGALILIIHRPRAFCSEDAAS